MAIPPGSTPPISLQSASPKPTRVWQGGRSGTPPLLPARSSPSLFHPSPTPRPPVPPFRRHESVVSIYIYILCVCVCVCVLTMTFITFHKYNNYCTYSVDKLIFSIVVSIIAPVCVCVCVFVCLCVCVFLCVWDGEDRRRRG